MAKEYIVTKGDTLNDISQRFGFKNYKEAGITGYASGNPDLIRPGERLTIGNYKADAGTASRIGSGVSNDAAAMINAGQDDDIANAPDPNEAPSRDGGSRTSRYAAAFSEIGEMFNTGDRPSAPNFTQTYNNLRDELNLDSLEEYVNDLQTEEEEIFATLRQRRTAERGKTVAQNVIEGRISQTERQESERLDYVRRQKATAVRQLQSANATIENLINFKKLDYDTARNEYNDQFNQQMSIFNMTKGIVDSEMADEQREQETARANLNIIYGAITEGTINSATMSPDMQYRVNQMELQAGLPTGFYENLRNQNPDGKILSTTTRTANGGKYADIILQNPDGGFSTKSIYLGAASSGDGADVITDRDGDGIDDVPYTWEEYLNAAQQELGMTINPDDSLIAELKAQYEKDYLKPAGAAFKYSKDQIQALETAGLLYADRQTQLNHLQSLEGDSGKNPYDPSLQPQQWAEWEQANNS